MHRKVDDSKVSDRGRHLLKVLVELYIREGQPVGSRTLAREAGLDLSPASIRNTMADLEDAGLVSAPHTSAGRVPTVQGYRVFVDELLTVRPPPTQAVQKIRRGLDPDQNMPELLTAASSLLSGVTHLAGLVMLPRQKHITLRQVAFLPLAQRRVLAVLVLNEREVQNRVVHTERAYSSAELEQVAGYINTEFAGQEMSAIRERLLQDMREAKDSMGTLMQAAAEMGHQAFDTSQKGDDYVLAGKENLLGCDEFSNIERMRQLFEAFRQKRDILHLLDQCLHAEGLQVCFGEESGYDALEKCTLITSPYIAHGRIGVLGVIGPTRIAYERVIPLVDATARLLGAALKAH